MPNGERDQEESTIAVNEGGSQASVLRISVVCVKLLRDYLCYQVTLIYLYVRPGVDFPVYLF